jgi:hypothetical protein
MVSGPSVAAPTTRRGQGPLGQEPLVIIQDLLAGVDPQVALSTTSRDHFYQFKPNA